MANERIITRYANRRLYDTAASRHVTLEDIRKLILNGEQIRVVDNRTGEDVTRTMLLQIVAEQEQHGKPILSTQLLHSILRFYGTAMEDLTAQYLEKSVEHLLRQQEMMRAQMTKMMNVAPMADLLEIARQNMNSWGDLQKRMFGLGPAKPAPGDKKKPEK
jgi:polyhydroxyalkanoate synthesis repressor PhaR